MRKQKQTDRRADTHTHRLWHTEYVRPTFMHNIIILYSLYTYIPTCICIHSCNTPTCITRRTKQSHAAKQKGGEAKRHRQNRFHMHYERRRQQRSYTEIPRPQNESVSQENIVVVSPRAFSVSSLCISDLLVLLQMSFSSSSKWRSNWLSSPR